MTGLVLGWNLAVIAFAITTVVVTVRRPVDRWTHGRWGKALSIFAALIVAFTWGRLTIPLGAVIVLLRHRHDRAVAGDVGMAEEWPW